jgi:hypothetical protein
MAGRSKNNGATLDFQSQLLQKNGADPEDRDEYLAKNVFRVPQEAIWSFLCGRAKQRRLVEYLDG